MYFLTISLDFSHQGRQQIYFQNRHNTNRIATTQIHNSQRKGPIYYALSHHPLPLPSPCQICPVIVGKIFTAWVYGIVYTFHHDFWHPCCNTMAFKLFKKVRGPQVHMRKSMKANLFCLSSSSTENLICRILTSN
jgi:hypothetical protein